MGNTSSSREGYDGYAALLVVERPLLSNLLPNESVIARLEMQDQVHEINEWPAQPVAVTPPAGGVLRCSFFAIGEDDLDSSEPRDCGEVVISRECLERYKETVFSIWLRLLDNSEVPYGALSQAQCHSLFEFSHDNAADANASKVCISVALVSSDIISGCEEDMCIYRRLVSEHPAMQLLSHSSDIIREYHAANSMLSEDLETAHRDFNSKEKSFQAHVVKSRERISMLTERCRNYGHHAASFSGIICSKHAFAAWHKHILVSKEERVIAKVAWMSSRLTYILEDRARFLHAHFRVWVQQTRQSRRIFKYFSCVCNDRHQVLTTMFRDWHQALSIASSQHICQENICLKAAVSFKISSVDFTHASNQHLAEIEAGLKETLLSFMSSELMQRATVPWKLGDDWHCKPVEARHIRVTISRGSDALVTCSIALPSGRSVRSVRNSLGTADMLAEALTQKLRELSGIQQLCNGSTEDVGACDVSIFTLRQMGGEHSRHALSDAIARTLERNLRSERLLTQIRSLRAWRHVVDLVKQQEKEDLHDIMQKRLAETMRRQHEEHLALMRSTLMKMWSDKHGCLNVQVIFFAWKDMLEAKRERRQEIANRSDRITHMLCSSSSTAELHLTFQCWKQQTAAALLLLERGQAVLRDQERQEILLQRALSRWGRHDSIVTMHILLHRWRDMVDLSKDEAKEDLYCTQQRHLAETLRRQHQEHLATMRSSMMKMWSDKHGGIHAQVIFYSWKDIVEDRRERRKDIAHRSDRLMYMMCSSDASVELHTLLLYWKQQVLAACLLKQRGEATLKTEMKHEIVLERALTKWGRHDDASTLHIILRAWSEYLAEDRRNYLKAVDLERHQLAKEVHDRRMNYALLQLEGSNIEFTSHLYFKMWREFVQDAKFEANSNITAEAHRLCQLHKARIMKVMCQMSSSDDMAFLHSTFSGWRVHCQQQADMLKLSEKMAKTKDSHGQCLEKALITWSDGHQALVLHAWHRSIMEERLGRERAEANARDQAVKDWSKRIAHMLCSSSSTAELHLIFQCWNQQTVAALLLLDKGQAMLRAQEIHAGKMRFVFAKMQADNDEFMLHLLFEYWQDLTQQSLNASELSGYMAEAERLKLWQKQNMHSVLQKTACVDDELCAHVAFAAWKDFAWESKYLKAISEHRQAVTKAHDASIDKAVLLWGGHHEETLLHMVIRHWHQFIADEERMAAQAAYLAERRRAKQHYEDRILSFLTKAESENELFILTSVLRAWSDLTQESKKAAEISNVSAYADRIRQLQTGPVRRSMYKLASVNAGLCMCTAFFGWRECVRDAFNMRRTSQQLAAKEKKHFHVIDKAVMTWGSSNDTLTLHIAMQSWRQDIADQKATRGRDDNATALRLKKAEYHFQLQLFLAKMCQADSSSRMHAVCQAWRSATDEALKKSTVANLQAELAHLLDVHAGPVRAMMQRFVRHGDWMTAQCVHACWRDFVAEQRNLRYLNTHLQDLDNTKDRHVLAMDKAALAWGGNHGNLLLCLVHQGWLRLVIEARISRTNATLSHARKTGVGSVLSRTFISVSCLHLQAAFACWRTFIKDARRNCKLDWASERTDRAHLSIFQMYILSRIRRAFIAWKQQLANAQKIALMDLRLQLGRQAVGASMNDQELRDRLGNLEHHLALQLMVAVRYEEESHADHFVLNSCVGELHENCNENDKSLSALEKEVELFEMQVNWTEQLSGSPVFAQRLADDKPKQLDTQELLKAERWAAEVVQQAEEEAARTPRTNRRGTEDGLHALESPGRFARLGGKLKGKMQLEESRSEPFLQESMSGPLKTLQPQEFVDD